LAGGQVRGASKKLGPPYLFLQPLKLATSNLVYNLIGLGEELAKKQHRATIGKDPGQGSI